MHNDFRDITDKLGEPVWYDKCGYPRYCDFHPDETSNIYADVVFFVEIACQACVKEMNVARSFTWYDLYSSDRLKDKWKEVGKDKNIPEGKLVFSENWKEFFDKFSKEELLNLLHYGDPPRHNCAGAGESMNCYDLRIKECWAKQHLSKWKRYKKLEIELEKIF